MRIKLLFLLLAISAWPAFAQDCGVRGVVVDAESGLPVAGATVILGNQEASAITGPDGDFLISTAKPAEETMTIIAYGYTDIVREVTLFNKVVDDLGVMKMQPDNSNRLQRFCRAR